ncbi:hypothetical protein FF38_06866 [Lucilia cuprina]|uniref:Uncharacterized protein n=1 Tax=Lucilia cuprina TaxID=7375 RepID=A0A0L0CMQ6_LUCCU|nr:hypothetical protein FF38_06866 [Lucilia cuprina]
MSETVKSGDLAGQCKSPKRQIRRPGNEILQHIGCGTCSGCRCTVLLEPNVLQSQFIMLRQKELVGGCSDALTMHSNRLARDFSEEKRSDDCSSENSTPYSDFERV